MIEWWWRWLWLVVKMSRREREVAVGKINDLADKKGRNIVEKWRWNTIEKGRVRYMHRMRWDTYTCKTERKDKFSYFIPFLSKSHLRRDQKFWDSVFYCVTQFVFLVHFCSSLIHNSCIIILMMMADMGDEMIWSLEIKSGYFGCNWQIHGFWIFFWKLCSVKDQFELIKNEVYA